MMSVVPETINVCQFAIMQVKGNRAVSTKEHCPWQLSLRIFHKPRLGPSNKLLIADANDIGHFHHLNIFG